MSCALFDSAAAARPSWGKRGGVSRGAALGAECRACVGVSVPTGMPTGFYCAEKPKSHLFLLCFGWQREILPTATPLELASIKMYTIYFFT